MLKYQVQLRNRDGVTFDVEPGESILDAARRAGQPMIAGCRTGACLTCAARLVHGRVHMPEGTALTAEMVRAHVVLPCVATVSSDVSLVVGRPGKPLLHRRLLRPWTD